jgi:aryl-alcohol dehydrogenase-like predicted oxidoreductase
MRLRKYFSKVHSDMEYASLGRTGLNVSRLCLGTMPFGTQCDEPSSVAVLDAAADAGINFFDTADVYPMPTGANRSVGATEEILGRWLRGRRQDFVVATKFGIPMGSDRGQRGASRRHILDSIDGSLRRLQTDYVDLYLLHEPDPTTPIQETLEALDEVVGSGKARSVGCSNFTARQFLDALDCSEASGLVRFESVQPRYNLLIRPIEAESEGRLGPTSGHRPQESPDHLLALCAQHEVGVIPYNPLAGGMLTGKYRTDSVPKEATRFALGFMGKNYRRRYGQDWQYKTVEALRPLAAEAGVSMVTMAVSWVLAHPAVTAPIIGASRPEQLADSVAAVKRPLDPELKRRIDAVSTEWRDGAPAER